MIPFVKRFEAAVYVSACVILGGCSGVQSPLDAQGPEAARVANLFWIFAIVCAFVWAAVVIVLIWAVWAKPPNSREKADPLSVDEHQDRRAGYIVSGLVGLTLAVLCTFTIASFLGSRGLASGEGAIEIEVTGYQWWWEFKYSDPEPTRTFTTANELHIPVGRPIKVALKSGDVIHSFWVPNLSGKMDLIPGQHNELTFSADRPGIYRGQCAEFCGLQHAKMALRVVAEPAQDFEAWRNQQLRPASQPVDPQTSKGREVFERSACILCHAIRGTIAGGRQGPDLTHFGSRKTIAAGTLTNTRDHLERWIANPQAFKPGTKMPQVPLNEDELTALSAYLEALK